MIYIIYKYITCISIILDIFFALCFGTMEFYDFPFAQEADRSSHESKEKVGMAPGDASDPGIRQGDFTLKHGEFMGYIHIYIYIYMYIYNVVPYS